ncbi:FUSC family protein [Herbiconiux sp.]|uniref:FUSC family protein n=1 Tax=Herbiconiux sp. TaxID=1871186 RepID=UPI0025C31FD2|nr:FUSC family protein [Herbiconiux sp.]
MSTASIPLTTGTRSPRTHAPAGAGLRGTLPHPRRLIEFGPHEGAHRVALRAGIAMAVPLGLLFAAGRLDLSLYAVFGAFTVLYGRSHSHVPRLRMQATAAVALVAAVVAGTAICTLPGREWIVVPAVAVVAVGTTFLSDALAWHPPGSLFFVFALAACASVPATAAAIPLALVLASASAAFGMLVSVVGLARPAARRVAPTSWRVSFAEAAARLGSGLGRRMLLVGVAVLVAGIVPTVSGLGHPYWAMVAAVAALGAADTAGHLLRAGHRVLGTVLGVALAAVLLAVAGGAPVLLVALVVLLQMAAELFVLRNYGLTVVFVTPLALIMAQLAHPVDEWGMLRDRTVETLLGAAVAVAASLAATALAARRRRVTTELRPTCGS